MLEAEVDRQKPQITQDSRGNRESPIGYCDLPEDIFEIGDFMFDDEDNVFIIEYGNKALYLQLDNSKEFIQARSGLVRFGQRPKKQKDTTYVFSKAHEIMQKVADYWQKPVMYFFFTGNDGIARWAVDSERGASVFNWQSSIAADGFRAIAIIGPDQVVAMND